MTPEGFSRFFDEDFADQSQDTGQSPLESLLPALGRRTASSRLDRSTAIHRGIEPELEESFTLDLFRLLGDEDGFEWPLDDLGRCLARGVFREHTKERLSSQEPEPETLDDTDGADRWKSE
jgi:hypothetical protein